PISRPARRGCSAGRGRRRSPSPEAWRRKIAGLGFPFHGDGRNGPRFGETTMTSILRAGVGLIAMAAMNTMVLAQDMPTKVGPGEGALNIVAWVGYVERGDSDKAYDWVTDFEKQTGCKVAVKTAATSDEMVTLMNTGGFDLVTASGDASLRLVAGKK